MDISDDKLIAALKEKHSIADGDIAKAQTLAKDKGTSLARALVSADLLQDEDVRAVEAELQGVAYVDLKKEKLDFEILSMIPEPIARNNNIVAISKSKEGLVVAMLDVDDLKAIDFVQKKVGMRILPRLTDVASIKIALQQYQKSLKAEFGDIIDKQASALKAIPDAVGGEEGEADLKKMAEHLPVVRIVDTLIKHAVIQNASDIHIEPMERQVLVRYRIDGILHDAMTLPKDAASGITARIKVLSRLKLDEKRMPQDGRFRMDTGDEKVSFRVSTLPTYYGEKTVMRLLRENAGGFTLEKLGFHGEGLERIHRATRQKTGMILTTGPTGSGKTTTLYTVLDLLNTPDVNISTVEDPVEYQMQRINQTQVKPDIGFTFSAGLRSLVRQDPDIIMVGEIRDHETASLGTNAALTGHLVLSTLHTNSAAGAIPRLVDMDMEPFLLVSTLKVIIGQRLVRRLCDDKEEHTLSKEEIAALAKSVNIDQVLTTLREEGVVGPKDTWETIPFYKPKESPECEDGYKGRVGIHEVLEVSPTIRDLMIKGATTEEIEKQAQQEGMMTMLEDGIFKAAQGHTTIEEVFRVINE